MGIDVHWYDLDFDPWPFLQPSPRPQAPAQGQLPGGVAPGGAGGAASAREPMIRAWGGSQSLREASGNCLGLPFRWVSTSPVRPAFGEVPTGVSKRGLALLFGWLRETKWKPDTERGHEF